MFEMIRKVALPINFVGRYLLMYLWFNFVGILSYASFSTKNGWLEDIEYLLDQKYLAIMALVFLIPAYFTMTRTYAVTDKLFREYVKKEFPKDSPNLSERINAVIRCPYLYAETAIVLVLILILPKLSQITVLWPKLLPIALLNLIMIVIAFVASLCGRVSAIRTLCHKEDFETIKYGRGDKNYGFWYLFGRVALITVVAPMSSVLVFYVVSLVSVALGLSKAFVSLSFWNSVFVAAAVVLAVVYARCVPIFFKRRKFLKKLKKVCRQNGYTVENPNKMIKSAFNVYDGFNFTLSGGGKKYDCKLVGSLSRSQPMYFSDSGELIRVKKKTLSIITGFGAIGFGTIKSIDLSHKAYSHRYEFESENQKMIIINPVPANIFIGHPSASSFAAGPGEKVGKYKIYNATGFLNAIERNCLDR